MMAWFQLHPQATTDHLGLIPEFLNPDDPRPAAEQIAENYCGGWSPMGNGPTLSSTAERDDWNSFRLLYPGDPPMLPLWATQLRDELVIVYSYGWTAIIQPDMTYAVDRLD